MSLHEQRGQERTQSRLAIAPLTTALCPPVPQLRSPEPVSPWLYSTILGNGHVLVCLDKIGSIAQLFYPYIDAGPHIRSFLSGIQVNDPAAQAPEGNVSWLAHKDWVHQLNHIDGAAAIHCISVNTAAGIQVEQIMAVHYSKDVLVNEIKITNLGNSPLVCKLITYAGLDIDYRRSGVTCYFNTAKSMLTFFSGDRYISLTCNAPVSGFGCDKTSLDALDFVFQDANEGKFNGREYAVGQVSGATAHSLGRIDPTGNVAYRMHICCGRSLDEVTALSASDLLQKTAIQEIVSWWQELYAHTSLKTASSVVSTVFNRSLITLRLLTDAGTGGIVAAPEIDPDFRSCGGYGPCWPRDGAFIGHTLASAGEYDHARMFYDWALRVQSESGVWYQRYYVNGQLAPTWGLVQFDETGAVVWAICRYVQLTGDVSYGQKAFPQLMRACEYMHKNLDPETGLAPMTKDLWEERDGISTYACASTWAGFYELSQLALKLGETSEAERWSSAASRLKIAIETHLWDAAHGRFLRGLRTRIHPHEVEHLRLQPGFSETDILETTFAGKPRYFRRTDATVDASILGLSIPFGVFSPDDPRMLASAEAVFTSLLSPVGGIRRYEDDPYRDGNPWVICTLWLALQDMGSGQQARALHLYNWVLEHRTSLDQLPEQVDRSTGEPCWVIPLGWSHAMFILATLALAEHEA